MRETRIPLLLGCAMGFVLFWLLSGPTADVLSQTPLWTHCGGVGPVTADWCGCTWGEVYHHGHPATDAVVTLSFGSSVTITNTAMDSRECFPYYALSASSLGARRHDVITITADYDGQMVSRVVRALPGSDGDQLVSLVLPSKDPAQWTHYTGTLLARVLTLQDTTLWEGRPSGLRSWDLDSGCVTEHNPRLVSTNTRAIAVSPAGPVWVGTTSGVAEYHNGSWQVHNPGLGSSDIWAIAVDPASGHVYVGADGDTTGGVSCYDGSAWHPLPDFNGGSSNVVRALWVDVSGNLWIGTYGDGATRCRGSCGGTYICTTQV